MDATKPKRRRSTLSPVQRTLRELRAQGRIAAIAEKWNPHVGPHGIRQDLFGFIDLVALDAAEGQGIIAVQACGVGGHAAHRKKIVEECAEAAREWLRCGGKIELWSWSKRKLKRGGKAERWMARVEEITLEAFEP